MILYLFSKYLHYKVNVSIRYFNIYYTWKTNEELSMKLVKI